MSDSIRKYLKSEKVTQNPTLDALKSNTQNSPGIDDDFQGQCTLVASTLKMMSHPQRLMLLCLLKEGPRTVSELQENLDGISQSHVSQFLNRLRLEGIVEGTRQGTFIYYSIKDPKVTTLLKCLSSIYCENSED
jgi:ArsR family transcriptional regulator